LSQEELLRRFEELSPEAQQRLLELTVSLSSESQGAPLVNLLEFAGILDEAEARRMEEAIAEGCERVTE
jgi:hypothetical protein